MLWDLRENLHGMMDITVGRTSGEVPQSRVEMSAGLWDYEVNRNPHQLCKAGRALDQMILQPNSLRIFL